MAALTGNKIKDSYLGLLKTTDSGIFTSSLIRITDGGGNGSQLYLSNTAIRFHNAYTFPNADGTVGQVLSTDGSGTLYFTESSDNQTLEEVLTSGNTATLAILSTADGNTFGSTTFDAAVTGTTANFTTSVTSPDFIGDLNGSVRFAAKMIGSSVLKGQVVYISGLNGNTPEVQLAKADSTTTMTAVGIAADDANQNASFEVDTLGSARGIDLSDCIETGITLTEGDVLYVSATEAGHLTNVAPTGVANLIQNIGMAIRVDPTTNATIKVMGAGRANALPNLPTGVIVGNGTSTVSVSSNFLIASDGTITLYQPNNVPEDKNNYNIGGGNIALNTGGFNTGFGEDNLSQVGFTGSNNSAFGYKSSFAMTTGDNNTSVGFSSLLSETVGDDNTAIGHYSLFYSNNGNYNTAIGSYSLYTNSLGGQNVALGYEALRNNTTSSHNTALGYRALKLSTGNHNLGVGYNSGNAIVTGNNNVVIGSNTGSTIDGLSNRIIISDGAANIRQLIDNLGKLQMPDYGSGTHTGTLAKTLGVDASGNVIEVGTLGVANGGTGATTLTGILLGNDASAISAVTDGTLGQVLSTDGSGVYSFITAATGVPDWVTFVTATTNQMVLKSGGDGTGTTSKALLKFTSYDGTLNTFITHNGFDGHFAINGHYSSMMLGLQINFQQAGVRRVRVETNGDLTHWGNVLRLNAEQVFDANPLYTLKFQGRITGPSGGSYTDNEFANIKGGKENATENDKAGFLSFETGIANGTLTEHLRISSTGAATFSSSVTASGIIETSGTGAILRLLGGGTSVQYQKFANDGGNYFIGTSSSTGTGLLGSQNAYAFCIVTESARDISFGTSNTSRLTINGTSGAATFSGTTSANVVIARDNMFVGTGQLYIGAENSSTNNSFRQEVSLANGTYKLQSRESGTWTDAMGFDNSLNATFSGIVSINGQGFLRGDSSGNLRIQGGTSSTDIRNNANTSSLLTILDGGNQFVYANNVNSWVTEMYNDTTTNPYGIYVKYRNVVPNSSGSYFLRFDDKDASRLYVYSNGNVVNVNNSYGSLSDVKLKENILDATPKLNDLLTVKIRNYNLIGDDNKQIGVIAQELEEIFPSMVEESPDTEDREVTDEEGNVTTEIVDLGTTTKSVKYSVFTPMLIKAIQEQQTIIEDLKTRIETLEG